MQYHFGRLIGLANVSVCLCGSCFNAPLLEKLALCGDWTAAIARGEVLAIPVDGEVRNVVAARREPVDDIMRRAKCIIKIFGGLSTLYRSGARGCTIA